MAYLGPCRHKNRLPHEVVVVVAHARAKEFAAWLKDCMRRPFDTQPALFPTGWPGGAYTGALELRYVVACESKADAMHVKLAWG